MIKAIIFDFDGVLMDSKEILNNFLLNKNPKITIQEIEEIFHSNPYSHPIIKDIIKQYSEELKNYFLDNTTKDSFYEGAIDLISFLENDFNLFINTSAPTYNVKHFLSLINKENSFNEVLGFDIEISKTKKFEMILKKYNLKKENCIFITDTLGDLKEAQEVSINSIGVTWGLHDMETLSQGKTIDIVDSFEELKSKISMLN